MGNWLDEMRRDYEATYTSDEAIVFEPPEKPLVDDWMIGELKAIYEKMKTQKCDWFLTITGVEGCLDGHELIWCNGHEVSIKDVPDMFMTRSYVNNNIINTFALKRITGKKGLYRIRFASGRNVIASADHKWLCEDDSWISTKALTNSRCVKSYDFSLDIGKKEFVENIIPENKKYDIIEDVRFTSACYSLPSISNDAEKGCGFQSFVQKKGSSGTYEKSNNVCKNKIPFAGKDDSFARERDCKKLFGRSFDVTPFTTAWCESECYTSPIDIKQCADCASNSNVVSRKKTQRKDKTHIIGKNEVTMASGNYEDSEIYRISQGSVPFEKYDEQSFKTFGCSDACISKNERDVEASSRIAPKCKIDAKSYDIDREKDMRLSGKDGIDFGSGFLFQQMSGSSEWVSFSRFLLAFDENCGRMRRAILASRCREREKTRFDDRRVRNKSSSFSDKRNLKQGFYNEVVESVEYIGERETFDLRVPLLDNYVLPSGMISHNSGKSSLAIAILWEWCKIVGISFADAIKDNIAFDEMDVLYVMRTFSKQREEGLSKRYYPWWFDEGANVFQNRDSHSSTRLIFLKYANAMRFFGRLIILCTPEFRQLDVYLREHRIKSLIRIERQGVYHYYDNEGMNWLTFKNKGVRDVHMKWNVASYRNAGRFWYCESIDKVIENMKRQFFRRLDMEIEALYIKLLTKKLVAKYKVDELSKEMLQDFSSADGADSEKSDVKSDKKVENNL
jgi:hypothetical protein